MIAGIKVDEEIIRDLERLGIKLYVSGQHGYWASLRIEPNLISRIKEAQKEDNEIWTIVENLNKQVEFRLDDDNVLWQDTRLVVPNDATLREALLTEAHSSPFSVHPGSTKMYHDLKQYFWWSGMKRDVATFVARCLICQQVKIEHQRASGLLQQLDIPVWKWDEISMDFVTGLPQTQRRHDAIWVVVDRLTKWAHFLPIRKDYSVSRLAEIFQQEIVRLHGTPSAIVSDRDPRFASRFWKGLQKAWGTRLKFNTAFHPQTDGQNVSASRASSVLDLSDLSRFSIELVRGYKYHPLHVITYPLDQIRTDLSYAEEPEAIIDRQDRIMRKKTIPFVKILWRNHPEREATWETEESIRTSYPHFLP
nr:transposon Ty3-I Gag-Pol polyprotein [Tanacetum cinerariifolium]